jgi:response regulator of citrate/malate metabolism
MTIRVLVVEDDFRVARLHADLAAAVDGMEVVGVVHTAADALALAEAERPDLVLLDEYLPDERGTSLIGRLDAAVMLISAETDAAVIRRAVAHGAVNVVLKPFAPPVLVQRLAAFGRFWASLESGQSDQRGVDRALAMLREGDSPAGRSTATRGVADAARPSVLPPADAPHALVASSRRPGIRHPAARREGINGRLSPKKSQNFMINGSQACGSTWSVPSSRTASETWARRTWTWIACALRESSRIG